VILDFGLRNGDCGMGIAECGLGILEFGVNGRGQSAKGIASLFFI
jgi:hypothetical protein